jgi:hypothetical protein
VERRLSPVFPPDPQDGYKEADVAPKAVGMIVTLLLVLTVINLAQHSCPKTAFSRTFKLSA